MPRCSTEVRGHRAARWWLRLGVAVALLSAINGCEDMDAQAYLDQGEHFILDARWFDSIHPLRACLQIEPDNAGAHFYLGRAYLHAVFRQTMPPWRLTVALGELDTALARFKEQGGKSPLKRFTAQEFEVLCHVTKAKVYLRKIEFGMSMGVPPSAMETAMANLQNEADAARAVMPESGDVAALDTIIAQFKGAHPAPVPRNVPVPQENAPQSETVI